MRVTKDALKYGLSVMNITPKEFLSLIESSNGYTGDDNNRWLTAQIIKIAEKDGVGYSQLLAKWFNIITEIEEESSDMEFRQEWVDHINSLLEGYAVYTVGMEENNDFGEDLSNIDWFDGVDISWNTWFTDEKLPESLSSALHEGAKVALVVNLGSKLPMKKGDSLVVDAKMNGISCTSSGAMMLYRLCNMLATMDYPSNFKVLLVSDTKFWLNHENEGISRYFLKHFMYDGFVINSKDLYNCAYTSEDFAVISCVVRSSDPQSGIVLPKVENGSIGTVLSRYSTGGNMWRKLVKSAEDSEGQPLGYICRSVKSRTPILSTVPIEDAECVAISRGNLGDAIGYYGVVSALYNAGMPWDIPELLSGHPEYAALVSNCVPVFLFGVSSNFKDSDGAPNAFDVQSSELVKKMLDKASQYFGYETKELMEVCKGFLDYLENCGESMKGRTFKEIRCETDNSELNAIYISALSKCLGYICTQYRRL